MPSAIALIITLPRISAPFRVRVETYRHDAAQHSGVNVGEGVDLQAWRGGGSDHLIAQGHKDVRGQERRERYGGAGDSIVGLLRRGRRRVAEKRHGICRPDQAAEMKLAG